MNCSICNCEIRENEAHRGENNKVYCNDCITKEENNLHICTHFGCDKWLNNDEIFYSPNGLLCKEHWDSMNGICSICGSIHPKDYLNEVSDENGNKILLCENCIDENYTECSRCGEIHHKSQIHNYEIHSMNYNNSECESNTIALCKTCRDNHFVECSHCGKLINKRDSNKNITVLIFNKSKNDFEPQKITGCDICLFSKYKKCEHCNTYYEKDYFKESMCLSCHYTKNVIHQYSYKPNSFKHLELSDDQILFGVENEFELDMSKQEIKKNIHIKAINKTLPVNYRNYIAYVIESMYDNLFYNKSDGSLRYGIEMVSYPLSFSDWMNNEEKIINIMDFLNSEGVFSDTAETAGMHIHISKHAMSKLHINAMNGFIYGHRSFIETIAGRKSNNYTKYINISNSTIRDVEKTPEHIIGCDNRYNALNWTNSKTVELRIFQSTTKPEKFMNNIRFCNALYYFTKDKKISQTFKTDAIDDFKVFLEQFDPNLLNFYKNNNWI